MTIALNGGQNPENIYFTSRGGTATRLDKVVFSRRGTQTTVWESFPQSIAEVIAYLQDSSSLKFTNCTYQGSYNKSMADSGKLLTVGRYSCTAEVTLKSAEWTFLGDVVSSSKHQWSYYYTAGIKFGYQFNEATVPQFSHAVHIDKYGMAVIDPSKIVTAQRTLSLTLDRRDSTVEITPESGDVIYYSTGNDIVYTGSATLVIARV